MFAARRNEGFSAAPKGAVALREARMGDMPARVRPHELLDQLVATQESAIEEPVVRRYPGYVRLAVPLAGSALLWVGIFWVARAMF